jgi:hypothetical protein
MHVEAAGLLRRRWVVLMRSRSSSRPRLGPVGNLDIHRSEGLVHDVADLTGCAGHLRVKYDRGVLRSKKRACGISE